MTNLSRLAFVFVAYSSASLAGRCLGQQTPVASPPPSTPALPTILRPDAPKEPAEAGKEKPSAKERLEAVRKKYLELRTYRDEGVSNVVLDFGVEPKSSMRTIFTTAFERGRRFRWEGKSTTMAPMEPGVQANFPEDSYSIWSTDPKSHFSYREGLGKRKSEQTLGMALEAAEGMTHGASAAVAMLLTSDERCSISSTIDFESPVEKEPEIVDGVRCTVIEGLRKGGSYKPSDVSLWIDENSLIRRVQQTNYIDPARKGPGDSSPPRTVKVTVNIKPVIDGKIDDRSFEPPPAAK